ncbi:MAG TPA: hypothetical protein VES20_02350, partial [Bryobacteraceae bacterium]|nr:hypothetical protein [Bryobacteraceae bacterium]
DDRDLEAGIAAGNGRGQLALDVLLRAIRRYLGAFLIELGGVDVLTFSGGIGENSAAVRAAVCQGLEPFGLVLDAEANQGARGAGRISAEGSAAQIHIVPADEERIVARATEQAIQEAGLAR